MSKRASSAGRLVRLLTDRRLAVALLLAFAVLSAIGTLVPQQDAGGGKLTDWRRRHPSAAPVASLAGLHRLHTSPVFLIVVGLLTLSTAACAWERTRIVRARTRSWEKPLASSSVTDAPDFELTLPGVGAGEVLRTIRKPLARSGLSVELGPDALRARTRTWLMLGSPVFHWSLALLFLLISAGRLTRFEGQVGIPAGEVTRLEASAFPVSERGPLSPGPPAHLSIRVDSFKTEHLQGGAERGPAARLQVITEKRVGGGTLVHSNAPLRVGSALVHYTDYGVALRASVIDSTGATVARSQALVDFEDAGLGEARFGLTLPGGRRSDVFVRPLLGPQTDAAPTAGPEKPPIRGYRVRTSRDGTSIDTTLPLDGSLPVGAGAVLRMEQPDYYVRLAVSDDWSVTPMYLVFLVGILGLSTALLVPPRRLVGVTSEDGGVTRLLFRCLGGDPGGAYAARLSSTLLDHLTGRGYKDVTLKMNREP